MGHDRFIIVIILRRALALLAAVAFGMPSVGMAATTCNPVSTTGHAAMTPHADMAMVQGSESAHCPDCDAPKPADESPCDHADANDCATMASCVTMAAALVQRAASARRIPADRLVELVEIRPPGESPAPEPPPPRV